MMPDTYPSFCAECPVPHVQNCSVCFGFGIYGGQQYPIAADVAVRATPGALPKALPCPVCGSKVGGMHTRSALICVRVVVTCGHAAGHTSYTICGRINQTNPRTQEILDRPTVRLQNAARRRIERDAIAEAAALNKIEPVPDGLVWRNAIVHLTYARGLIDELNTVSVEAEPDVQTIVAR